MTGLMAQIPEEFRIGSPKTWTQAKIDAWYGYKKSLGILNHAPDRRDNIIAGNQIRTIIWDHGSIGQPGREPSLEWPTFSKHGYAYEFGPFVGIEVPIDTNGHFMPYFDEVGSPVAHDSSNQAWATTHVIISDGLRDGGSGGTSSEFNPETGARWQWEPVEGFVNPNQDFLAVLDEPGTWPLNWTSWPGTYQVGASTADQAAFFVMDDRDNLEFTERLNNPFYPFPDDTTIGGLGLRVEVRVYQWSNPLANDAIFFVYAITNTSQNDYEKVVFGMFGDPHIGGAQDFGDDWALFDKRINMVYGFDADNRGQWGGRTGWMGYMFLESPGNATDGIDNDEDGLVDESMFDGIDNDNDWNVLTDDVGIDGVGPDSPFYTGPDEGEGDTVPTAGDRFNPLKPGEPNFEGTDLDESDQIGLTSFNAENYGTVRIEDDIDIWRRVRPLGVVDSATAFTDINQNSDNVFIYGSGYFPLYAGETQRFSIALLMGEDETDLFNTAQIVQKIYNSGYRFAKAPDRPILSAFAGDSKVTLYWDDAAEDSWDPVYGFDFEGYSIYRATDPGFREVYTITDNNGAKVLWRPLARFDVIDGISGESAVGIRGVHFDLGNETGLVHEYVDETAINGILYFYAVVSYDFGDTLALFDIPPTESAKRVKEERLTGILTPDPNVAIVTPSAPSPGTVHPQLTSFEHSGPGSGQITVKFIDPALVRDSASYRINFGDPVSGPADTVMYVTDLTLYSVVHSNIGYDWFRASDLHVHLVDIVITLEGTSTEIDTSQYDYITLTGVMKFDSSLVGSDVRIDYHNQPVWQSRALGNEDVNPAFDGIRLYVADDLIEVSDETGWLVGESNYVGSVSLWTQGAKDPGRPWPHTFEIHWKNSPIASVVVTDDPQQEAPFIIVDVTYPDSITSVSYFLENADIRGTYVNGQSRIVLLREPVLALENITWQLKFAVGAGESPVEPIEGDIFQIKINAPFSYEDEFLLTTSKGLYDPSSVENPLDRIAVVPNPYLAQSLYEPESGFASGRGDREIHFINLPPVCTIRIYTVAGDLVTTIEHNESMWNGRESYNLLNKENMEIAFGMYIWHVDAEKSNLGQKIGKFAVIK